MMAFDLREGQKVAAGEFLLDEAQARDKLGQFQLVDPRFYVLEFVKAAVLLGASRVEFEISASETVMRFDGHPVRSEDVDELAIAAFRTRRGPRDEALRHLAIGASAAQTLGLREFTLALEDGWGDGTALKQGHRVMRVYLRQRWRVGHVAHRLGRLVGASLAEVDALKMYCAYASVPIEVNRERVSRGLRLPSDVIAQVDVDEPGIRGVIGLSKGLVNHGVVHVTVLQHGVALRQREYDLGLSGAVAVIEAATLTTNLSQSDFVEDDAWRHLHSRVLVGGILRSVGRYLSELSDDYVTSHRAGLRLLVGTVASRIPAADLAAPKSAHFAAAVRDFASVAESLPIYPVANGPGGDDEGVVYRSIRELRVGDRERGQLFVSSRTAPGVRFAGGEEVMLCDEHSGAKAGYMEIFAGRVMDVTDALEQLRQARINRKIWEARPLYEPIDARGWPHQRRASVEDLEITVGWRADDVQAARIAIVKEGRLLVTRELSARPLNGLVVEISGPIVANLRFDGPCQDSHYTRAALEALEMVGRLYRELAAESSGRAYRDIVTRRNIAAMLAGGLQIAEPVFDAWAAGTEGDDDRAWRVWGSDTQTQYGSTGMLSLSDAMLALEAIAAAERDLEEVELDGLGVGRRAIGGSLMEGTDSDGDRLQTEGASPVIAELSAAASRQQVLDGVHERLQQAGFSRGRVVLDWRGLSGHELCRVFTSTGEAGPATVVGLNSEHPVIRGLLEAPDEAMPLAFVASAVMSHLIAHRQRFDPEIWHGRAPLLVGVLTPCS
jgi:hypothetical protein